VEGNVWEGASVPDLLGRPTGAAREVGVQGVSWLHQTATRFDAPVHRSRQGGSSHTLFITHHVHHTSGVNIGCG